MVHVRRDFLEIRKFVICRFVRSFQAEGASRANALWLELGWQSQGTRRSQHGESKQVERGEIEFGGAGRLGWKDKIRILF